MNANTINLETLEGIPREYLCELEKHKHFFEESDSFENIENIPEIQKLIEDINAYCENNMIVGFHYTRAECGEIQEKGLICRTVSQIRERFLKTHGDKFTSEEILEIETAWGKYYTGEQREARDSRIFFNFTKMALGNSGAEPLLKYFGGEQVHMAIRTIPGVENKIKIIGTPLVLECILNPKRITTITSNPWGKIAVSSYHRTQNPEAGVFDQDGFQVTNVRPENIKVSPYS